MTPALKDERMEDVSAQEEPQRGRKKLREENDEDAKDEDGQGTGERKRKRSRKGLDKKYLCPEEGCGKSYSRAEHLYRHQLNHSPKQIYYCDYPECPRHFVRQDLCVRHRERHSTKGSNLQRKDNYIAQSLTEQGQKTVKRARNGEVLEPVTTPYHPAPQPSYDNSSAILHSPTDTMGPPRHDSASNDTYRSIGFQNAHKTTSGLQRSNSDSQYYGDGTTPQLMRNPSTNYSPQQRHGSFGALDSTGFQRPVPTMSHTDSNASDSSQWNGSRSMSTSMPNHSQPYNGFPPAYPPVSSIPTIYTQAPQNGGYQAQQYYPPGNEYLGGENLATEDMSGNVQNESPLNNAAYPVYEEFNFYGRSPSTLPDGFMNWLVDPANNHQDPLIQQDYNPIALDPSLHMPLNNSFPALPPQTSISVSSLLEPTSKIAAISDAKRQLVIDLIDKRFIEPDGSPIAELRDELFKGDWDANGHVLSRESFQTYVGSYWYHFHDQMPILHRPTFSADKCQPLLLIAILAIGAANLDKMHGQTTTAAAADFANFLAWHLRSKLFEDRDFPPPTKLWVLQALILLECFEKLYSSRALHERSNVHHATTISLLRRGSALLGRSSFDSPDNEEDRNPVVDTGDPWWNHWITNEATKRVAYALFIIDSTHAMMFGHTAVMMAHEMRLTLPCDEALWMANSGMEVGRLEQALKNDNVKLPSFADGLKSTMNGKPVRTNRFGRTAIMAGLLNVTFHLGQRDMLRSLGPFESKNATNWKGALTKAFDIWEKDWDNEHEPPMAPIAKSRHIRDSSHSSTYSSSTIDEEHTFESRVVLHHLAHMGMHVDVVQCQVYAKAKRLLGRRIMETDYSLCAKKMKDWAGKALARDAVFYSLKFLNAVLLPDVSHGAMVQQRPPPFKSGTGEYVPRDDYLLNRPWVVYFAALVVWSYGYTLDGPLKPASFPSLETKEEQTADMRKFMTTVGAVAQPGDLMSLNGRRNGCAGLLSFLGTQFKKSRWELMHEASTLLGNCVDMLRGGGSGNGIA